MPQTLNLKPIAHARARSPILEAGGVDIVMHGHSHVYERTLPVVGFTGPTAAWTNASVPGNATFVATLTTGSTGIQTQTKAAGVTAMSGTTYVVAGSGGQLGTGKLNLPHRVVSLSQSISCGLDFTQLTMTLTCINATGEAPSIRTACAAARVSDR